MQRIGKGRQHSRRAAIRQRTAILISRDPAVLASVQTTLTEAKFSVFATTSPFDGYDYALHTLGTLLPSHATVFLIDTNDVYSVLVAAGLSQRMREQVIPSAWLIALLDTQSPEREVEARLAGCQHVLHLPITEDAIGAIQQLLKRPAPLPQSDRELHPPLVTKTLQTIADRVLQSALEVQPDQWTAPDVACLLQQLTLYPIYPQAKATEHEQWKQSIDVQVRTEQIIRTLGGVQGAREFLADCVSYLELHYPIHSEILEKFLAGWQRKTIIRHFVNRGLYEDTRIYTCIKELPQRISDILKVQGA